MSIQVLRGVGPEWERAIAELMAAGVPVPLPARPEYAERLGGSSPQLVVLEDSAGRCIRAAALDVSPTNALPGHRIARAHHGGAEFVGPEGDALLAGLAEMARNDSRLLRLTVELVLRSAAEQERVAAGMRAAGFSHVEKIRNYRNTLIVDLGGTEEELLASFSATTRRDLRGWAERPVEMRPIEDPRYGARLNALAQETFGRTGGAFVPRPWAERIALCRELPSASRLVGLFRAGRDDPDALLAYAWGCSHGDHAHYDDAGSTRVEDIKVSMMYPLMWDLMRWAKAQGCAWFDMGGAVPADAKDDPRLGISDFKRRFSKELVAVGAEWELEPHPGRAALARTVRGAANRLRGRGA